MASGAFGLGVSDAVGLPGSEEHPAMNPAARIATNNFFRFIFIIALSISVFLIGFCGSLADDSKIIVLKRRHGFLSRTSAAGTRRCNRGCEFERSRSEEDTSELQS